MDRLRRWLRKSLPLLGGIGLLFGTAQAVEAQDPGTAALLERLERLEQQNEELRRRLDSGSGYVNLEQEVGAQQIQKIVADYLKEVDKKKKADDDAKKKKAQEEGVEVGKDKDYKVTFKEGISFATSDGAFKAALRGRWQMDWGWAEADQALENRFAAAATQFDALDDGILFRRARLGIQGTLWEVTDFVAEFDWAPGVASFREMWMGVRELPVIQNFRAGHFKRIQGLEHLTSSRFLTFIERNACEDAFIEDYDPGLLISRGFFDDRATLAAGLYQRAPDDAPVNIAADGNYTGIVRATILPLWQQDGRYMVHLGASAGIGADGINDNPWRRDSQRTFQSRPYRIEASPFISAGNLIYDDRNLFIGEFATVIGPFSVQAEYYFNYLTDVAPGNTNNGVNGNGPGIGGIDFHGYYVYVSYFLTGENRQFSRSPSSGPSSPSFTRPIVYEPFFLVRRGEKGCGGCCCGKGAWEIAARYGFCDLNDGPVAGGKLSQYTLGLNWYWNRNMKIQWNYEHLVVTDRSNSFAANTFGFGAPLVSGDADTFVMRFAWDF